MRQTRKQKGFILLLVIALIPLLGMASVVLTSNSRQIITNTRRTALKTHAQLACESGIAWVMDNGDIITMEQPFLLEIDHEEKTITCNIELISHTNTLSVFNITGKAEDKRFICKYPKQLTIKH